MTDTELKAYFDDQMQLNRAFIKEQMEAMKAYNEARFTAIKDATDIVAHNSIEKFAQVNEFRAALADQQSSFVPRIEYMNTVDALQKEVHTLSEYKARLEGMATQKSVTQTMIIAIIASLIGGISLVLNVVNYLVK